MFKKLALYAAHFYRNHFLVKGYINKHNCRNWNANNP